MLTGKGLRKRFARHDVLNGVDACVPPGSITAIIGPSGGGKSTLLRAMALLDPPDAGTVEMDGTVYAFPSAANGKPMPWPLVTIVFQQLFLWPHLTLRDNIELPLRLRHVSPSDHEVDLLLARFELDAIADRYPNEVSIGQRQRGALVRALALRPRYLLLDEITSALDVEHVGRVLEQLMLERSRGMGVLLVTHLIGFARRAADTIFFMEHGAITEQGSASVLSQPRTERLARFLSLVDTAS
jgi:polar amino acid transport system ATP-binding protein